jgi:hypothetical protein
MVLRGGRRMVLVPEGLCKKSTCERERERATLSPVLEDQ